MGGAQYRSSIEVYPQSPHDESLATHRLPVSLPPFPSFCPSPYLSILQTSKSPKLVHELTMKLDNPTSPLGAGREECGPEVKRALLLPKAGAGDDADTGGVEQAVAV